MNEKNDMHIVWLATHAKLKCACRFFHSYLNEMKKSTVSSYNLISYHLHAKFMGKQ